MKVGVSGYIGDKKTGIGNVLENILYEVIKLDSQIIFYVFTNYDQNDLFSHNKSEQIIIIKYRISKSSSVGNIIWHQFMYQYNLWKYDCDISFIPNFALILWKNRPTAVIIHDMIEFVIKNKFSKLKVFYRHFIVPRMAKLADIIFTVSEMSKKDILKFCGVSVSKIVVALNAHDKNRFRVHDDNEIISVLKKYDLNMNEFILSLGTIDYPGKNVYNLIKAFITIKEKYNIRTKLVIIGKDGHNSHVVYDLAKNSQYSKDIIFLGYISDDDIPYFYNSAVLFCFLSFYEGFGLPMLEAIASGCPSIVSNVPSHIEIVYDSAVIVDPSNCEDITRGISKVLNSNEIRSKLRKCGLARATNFSWERTANIYLKNFYLMQSNIDFLQTGKK